MENFDPNKESEGLGDTIAKVTNFLGIDKAADTIAKLAGKADCGCNRRREFLNQLFPYHSAVKQFKVLKEFHHGGKFYAKGETIHITKESGIAMKMKDLITEEFLVEV